MGPSVPITEIDSKQHAPVSTIFDVLPGFISPKSSDLHLARLMRTLIVPDVAFSTWVK
jgi:hypothetical protein